MAQRFLAPLLLVCAVALGAFLTGRAIGQEEEPAPAVIPAAPAASLGTAFTYQGQLLVGGQPTDGVYDFRFRLYEAPAGGAPVAPQVVVGNVAVTGGAFSALLDFGPVFEGQALWLAVAVRPGSSTGAFTALSPRQPLTAAPYALGLVPGAAITGTLAGGALTLGNGGGDGLAITHAASDGIFICSTGDETGCRRPPGAATSDGIEIARAGGHGVRVDSARYYGVYVNSAGSHGVFVDEAGHNGVRVNSAGGIGVLVDESYTSGFVVNSAGGNGLRVYSADANGVHVSSVADVGVLVASAGDDGVRVGSVGRNGVRVASAVEDGIDADGDMLAGDFHGPIAATSCSGCLLTTFGLNGGPEALEAGTIVTVLGMQAVEMEGIGGLLEVAPATAGEPVVGVVQGRAELHLEDEPRPGQAEQQLIPREGPAEPGEYVTIIFSGPVQVKASDLDGPIAAGARLAVAGEGRVRPLKTKEIEGMVVAEGAPTVGIALSQPDTDGMVWVLVNPQ